MFIIEKAIKKKQKKDAQWVRHKVYCGEEGLFEQKCFAEGLLAERHDAFDDSIILVAYHKSRPIGTISSYVYSDRYGLPIEGTISLFDDKFKLDEFLENRSFSSPLYSCGMLAITEDFRGSNKIAIWLYRFVFELGKKQGCEDVIITINHKLEEMARFVGFNRLVEERRYSDEIGNYVYLMYAKISDIAKVLELQNIPDWCEKEFADSFRIGIWHNEDIIKQGEKGESFFLILEGWAKVVQRTENRQFLFNRIFQGQTFGETALFSGTRTATVFTSYCAAKILSKKETFAIIANPKKAKMLIRVLIERLVEMNKKVKAGFLNFEAFSSVLQKRSFENLPVRSFSPSEVICSKGEEDRQAYIVKKGKVQVIVPDVKGEDIIVSTMKENAFFGYMVFFNQKRTASVIAQRETQVYVISEDFFWNVFENIGNRKKIINDMMVLTGQMNFGYSQDPESESFLLGFKDWLINYFKTYQLQENVENKTSDLTIDLIKKDLDVDMEKITDLIKQLVIDGALKEKEGKFTLVDEKKLKEFKFNF